MPIKSTIVCAAVALGLAGTALADGSSRVTVMDDQALDRTVAGSTLILETPGTGVLYLATGAADATYNNTYNKQDASPRDSVPISVPLSHGVTVSLGFDQGG